VRGDGTIWRTDLDFGTVNATNQNGGNRRVLVGGQNAPGGIAIPPAGP
jgi:hypothetical protein